MKIYAGSDHAGFELRRRLVTHLRERGHEVEDLGPPTADRSDYPDYAAKVGRAVRDNPGTLGVLACGSGVGVCMAANKVRGVRAANAWSVEAARLSRQHNDANVICVGERLIEGSSAIEIVDAWLAASFEGGRHADRVRKIGQIESDECKGGGRR